jgi:hypothetical protein
LSISVDFEYVDASLVYKLFIIVIPCLHIGGSSYEVKLLCKIDAASDYGCRLFIEIEKLDDSLINLLFYSREMILEAAN